MRTKAIIVPGNGNDKPEYIWHPYLKTELEKLGIETVNVEFPDPDIARSEYWLPYIKELGADENTMLIGHSSGAVAAMRYAETNKIFGSVLLGVYTMDLGDAKEKQSGYFDTPWNWKAIKNNQQWVMVFASTDDQYIPIEQPREIRDKLNAEYYEYTDKGHWGQKEIPEVIEAIKKRLVV